ncbi:DoxX family protein [Pseudooctadecabacter sp.]|uniref:DoxX family protein n=1 Tax=Pseudooctadecabacter sp. TaxID=1966338 RepID=UPI0025DB65AF|nr:DoxX family membrane protein [Pseudooctadecabacter sp.]
MNFQSSGTTFGTAVKLTGIAMLVYLVTATTAFSHVRWFVDANVTIEDFESYTLTSPEVLIWIAISVVIVAASVVLDALLPNVRIVGSETRHDFIEILRIFTGMSMLLTAYEGAIIAPHLIAFGEFGTVLIFLQAIIGILFIANRFIRHAAILLLILHLGLTVKFGLLAALEYFIMVGIGIFLLINNLPTEELRERYKPFSVAILRICAGISLIVLGLAEKLFGAVLAESFLAANTWNFLPAIGFDFFTDRLFALSAGFVEVIFGVILVLGTTTRLNVLALSVVLLASNVLFLIEGNNEAALVEFVGHMPVIGVALILMLLGAGQRWRLRAVLPARRKNTNLKTIRVPSDA